MYFFKRKDSQATRVQGLRFIPSFWKTYQFRLWFFYRYRIVAHTIDKREKFIYHDAPCTQTPPNRESLPDEASINWLIPDARNMSEDTPIIENSRRTEYESGCPKYSNQINPVPFLINPRRGCFAVNLIKHRQALNGSNGEALSLSAPFSLSWRVSFFPL